MVLRPKAANTTTTSECQRWVMSNFADTEDAFGRDLCCGYHFRKLESTATKIGIMYCYREREGFQPKMAVLLFYRTDSLVLSRVLVPLPLHSDTRLRIDACKKLATVCAPRRRPYRNKIYEPMH